MKKTNNYLALGGLFACLHVIFMLFSKFVVGSEIILVIFLPLLSCIYTLKCDKKSVLSFALTTIFVCFLFDITATFIYVVPSLFCGILYGILKKKNLKELELVYVTSFAHMISIVFSFLIITILFKEIDFLEIFEKIFSLNGEKLIVASLLLLMVLGFFEAFLVHVITDNEIIRFGEKVLKSDSVPKWFFYVVLCSFTIFLIIYPFSILYSIFPMMIFIIFYIPWLINGLLHFKLNVILILSLFVFSFIAIILLNYLDPLIYPLLLCIATSPFLINAFKNNFVDNKEKGF